MSNFCDQVKLISESYVKPKYQVEPSKQPYYLSPIDLMFLNIGQIQKGLLFTTKPTNIQSDFIDTLRNSLAVALVHFYPFAGQLSTQELRSENARYVYLDCTKGPGVGLVHAKVDLSVSEIILSVDVHPIVRSFFDLGEKAVNRDGHTRSLLSVQVTELVDGVFIGFTMNHCLVDGNSEWHFINSLSEIFHQMRLSQGNTSNNNNNNNEIIPISRNPVFKPYFPDGWGPILKLPSTGVTNSKIIRQIDQVVLRERIFHFSSESIKKIKGVANEECGVHNISSFQALSGFMWRSITRARNLKAEDETCCGIAMDARPRFSPPLTSDYFGNFALRQESKCNVGALLSNGVGWAAMLVHQIVIGPDDKKVCERYERVVKYLCGILNDTGTSNPYYTPNLVMIGGSARFDMYGPEFGLGKAQAVLAGYSNKADGKITANPGCEGGGSVDLEVCLKRDTMNALELDEEFMSFITLKS